MRIVIPALMVPFMLFAANFVAAEEGPKTDLVFFGTYTQKGSKGIYRSEFDPATGKLSAATVAAETGNPSFLGIHPSGKFLFCVGEDGGFKGKKSGAVAAFSLDAETGKLQLINREPTDGPGPCHVSIDPAGKFLAAANYGGGGSEKGPWTNNFTVFAIAADGKLLPGKGLKFGGKSVHAGRQNATHPHSVNFTPDGKFLLVADLGTDKVTVHALNNGEPAEASTVLKLAPGAGPRHLDLDGKGERVYVVNELNSTVTVFDLKSTRELQTITTLPKGDEGKKSFPAEIRVHRKLGYVYASNRGHDSIAIFKIGGDGTLTAVGHQRHPQLKEPRGFTLHGNYLLAAGQNSSKVIVFRIDPATGNLTALDEVIDVPVPVCIRVLKRT